MDRLRPHPFALRPAFDRFAFKRSAVHPSRAYKGVKGQPEGLGPDQSGNGLTSAEDRVQVQALDGIYLGNFWVLETGANLTFGGGKRDRFLSAVNDSMRSTSIVWVRNS